MGVTPRAIDLHIEELILEGVDAAAGDGVGEALERHLAQLLTDTGQAFAADATVAHLRAAPLAVSVQARPQDLGAAIAGSVHESLTR